MNLEANLSDIAPAIPAFATPEPITVSVELPVGDVRIVASDRSDTTVQVKPTDESRELDVRYAAQTRVERVPGGLLVKAPRQRGLGLLGKPGSVDITIELRPAPACTATPRSRPSTRPGVWARSGSRPRSATSTSTGPAGST